MTRLIRFFALETVGTTMPRAYGAQVHAARTRFVANALRCSVRRWQPILTSTRRDRLGARMKIQPAREAAKKKAIEQNARENG